MGTCGQISDSFVSDKVDLAVGIATPSAQSLYNAAMDTDIPVIYTAVTDPLAAELVDEDGNPVGEVTGTSDKLPVKQQLEMIREILPDAKTIGILYTTSEANSESSIKNMRPLQGTMVLLLKRLELPQRQIFRLRHSPFLKRWTADKSDGQHCRCFPSDYSGNGE